MCQPGVHEMCSFAKRIVYNVNAHFCAFVELKKSEKLREKVVKPIILLFYYRSDQCQHGFLIAESVIANAH
jgi:hypothetical protein